MHRSREVSSSISCLIPAHFRECGQAALRFQKGAKWWIWEPSWRHQVWKSCRNLGNHFLALPRYYQQVLSEINLQSPPSFSLPTSSPDESFFASLLHIGFNSKYQHEASLTYTICVYVCVCVYMALDSCSIGKVKPPFMYYASAKKQIILKIKCYFLWGLKRRKWESKCSVCSLKSGIGELPLIFNFTVILLAPCCIQCISSAVVLFTS